jgi:hypothetical protein
MKKCVYLLCAISCVALAACNYNNYDRNSPYRGSVEFEHPDETVVRPTKTKTMTVKRDLTTTSGGTVHTQTVTETVTIPEDVSDSSDYKKAQRDINPNGHYIEVDVNKTYR